MHTLKGSSRAERTIIFIIFLDHILGFSYIYAVALATLLIDIRNHLHCIINCHVFQVKIHVHCPCIEPSSSIMYMSHVSAVQCPSVYKSADSIVSGSSAVSE